MNPGIEKDHPSIDYYDSDYPSPFDTLFPQNFDQVTEYQGLAFDIQRYRDLAQESGGPVLELCCGTGRVAIPLARDGFEITGVDISHEMLQKFRQALTRENSEIVQRLTLIEQDITRLQIPGRKFQTAILAFNSLLCLPEFNQQCSALKAISTHLNPGAKLILDIVNPLRLKIDGDSVPYPFFTRTNRTTGNSYTRFAMVGPFDADQKQQLYGWYDEITPEGLIKRRHYSLYWRPIFRYEIELMLQQAGFRLLKVEGGHQKESYTSKSPRMFLISERIAS